MDIESLNIKNHLLTELAEKKITMREFDKECAYWYIKFYEVLHPLAAPTNRPKELIEYDALAPHEKKSLPEKFWRQTEIYNYLEHKQKVIEQNRSTLKTLKEFKEYIPIEDTPTRDKYDELIREYENNETLPDDLKTAYKYMGGSIERKDFND